MEKNSKNKRLLSVDVLRGFDMFFISGGGTFIVLLKGNTGIGWIDLLADQLQHPSWHGFTFYDFIMPLFLFVSGVSLSFSLSNGLLKKIPKRALYKKALKRMLILIVLGIIYKNNPIQIFDPSEIRLGSVLGRIGIACFFTSLLYLNFSVRSRVFWISGILLSYYAILYVVPVPGYGAGDLSFEGNIVGYIDRLLLPGRLLNGTYDELGIITQFPALCIAVFGSIAGDVLLRNSKDSQKLKFLCLAGACILILGLIWSLHFPINKKLWSSSFILVTSGLGFLILSLFYWTIDVKGFKKWALFFKVIGMNSIAVYFIYHFVNFRQISTNLFGGLFIPFAEQWQDVFQATGALALVWLFFYLLYKREIFIKI